MAKVSIEYLRFQFVWTVHLNLAWVGKQAGVRDVSLVIFNHHLLTRATITNQPRRTMNLTVAVDGLGARGPCPLTIRPFDDVPIVVCKHLGELVQELRYRVCVRH